MSDLAIRNLFIIPTIVFLIVFNIFPLLYSLGYSFTDFRASDQRRRRTSSACQNYRDPPQRPLTSGRTSPSPRSTSSSRWTGQVIVGFGVGDAAQPRHPA
jgi:multiple sugar transport system permease protein